MLSIQMQMAAMGHVIELEKLYQKNPDSLDTRDPKHWTPLHHAASYNQPQAITFLCNRGAGNTSLDTF